MTDLLRFTAYALIFAALAATAIHLGGDLRCPAPLALCHEGERP